MAVEITTTTTIKQTGLSDEDKELIKFTVCKAVEAGVTAFGGAKSIAEDLVKAFRYIDED